MRATFADMDLRDCDFGDNKPEEYQSYFTFSCKRVTFYDPASSRFLFQNKTKNACFQINVNAFHEEH